MSNLFLDDLVTKYMMEEEEEEELGIGFHEMTITKIRNKVNNQKRYTLYFNHL